MTITVNTPDGGTAQFPDDTDPATITSAMKAKFGGPDDKPSLTDDSTSGQIGNFAYHAANTGLFHGLDYGLAGLHAIERGAGIDPNATDLDQIRAENADYSTKHPIASGIADVAGYAPLLIPGVGEAVGIGKVGAGLADLGMNARLAKGVGGAVEGGAISGLGAATSGDNWSDSGKAALIGGAIGGPLGAIAGKAAPAVGDSIADLQNAADNTIAAAEAKKVGNIQPYQDVAAARDGMTPGVKSGITPRMQAQLDNTQDLISNSTDLNAKDLWSMRKNINNVARKGSDEDKVAAKTVGDSLYNLAPDEMDAASSAHAELGDAQWLKSTTDPAKLVKGAQKRMDSPQMVGQMTLETQQAMQTLADSAPGWLNRTARNVGGIAANMGVGHVLGGGFGEAALGTILGYERSGGSGLGGWLTNRGLNSGTKKAREAALNTILSGQLTTPGQYSRIPKIAGALASINNIVGQTGSY